MDYDTYLAKQFGDLEINLVRHNTSPTGCPTYVEVKLGKMPKDKGTTAKDLSNYLYRMGLKFQTVPEYLGRGKTAVLRFYMTWDDLRPLLPNVFMAVASGVQAYKAHDYLPFAFNSLIIQNTKRGVYARRA